MEKQTELPWALPTCGAAPGSLALRRATSSPFHLLFPARPHRGLGLASSSDCGPGAAFPADPAPASGPLLAAAVSAFPERLGRGGGPGRLPGDSARAPLRGCPAQGDAEPHPGPRLAGGGVAGPAQHQAPPHRGPQRNVTERGHLYGHVAEAGARRPELCLLVVVEVLSSLQLPIAGKEEEAGPTREEDHEEETEPGRSPARGALALGSLRVGGPVWVGATRHPPSTPPPGQP
ncbi:uncharacterized protein [Equus caballus]|uniref:uncharacterized protein n=1 Tax=Equus caballus TaxID=9796 RepID=UPI0038B30226